MTIHLIRRAFTGAVWEDRNGYCRAMRVPAGTVDLIYVTGTTAVGDEGSIVAPGRAGPQAERCYAIIESALRQLGATLDHIVRSRVFLTDMSQADDIGAVHKRLLGHRQPCLTLVGCSSLIHSDMVVEIECDAVVGGAQPSA
jgi:enamine deaminase RidA (YjgF/YER057c/UK114 family)